MSIRLTFGRFASLGLLIALTACSTVPSTHDFASIRTNAVSTHANTPSTIHSRDVQPTLAVALTGERASAPANVQCAPGTVLSQIETSAVPTKRVVKGFGYGAPPKGELPTPQKRIMALRAAKLDAYRDLAEKISGLRVVGNTALSNLTIQTDHLRTYIDTTVKDASVVSVNSMGDGTYEAVLEVTLTETAKGPTETTASCVPVAMPSSARHTAESSLEPKSRNTYF